MKIRLFLLGILLGAGASFLIPKPVVSQNQVGVSATVLEHLTCIKISGEYKVTTNLVGGYWKLSSKDLMAVVAKY